MTNRNEFKRLVKVKWPHVRVTTRTVGFVDLARTDAIFATLENETAEEWKAIKDLGGQYGIIVQGGLR